MRLLEARLQILILLILIFYLKILMRRLILVGEGVSVHDMNAMYTVHTYMPYVAG